MHRQATLPAHLRINAETNQYFAKPSQESAEIHLERGMAAVVFYISPEETGNGWREGAISVAVIKKNLVALSDAIEAMQSEYGAAYKTRIAIITVHDDIRTIADVKKFINSSSITHPEFRTFQQQLEDRSAAHFFTVEDKKIIHLNFAGTELKVDYPEFKNESLRSATKSSFFNEWLRSIKIPSILTGNSTNKISSGPKKN